MSALELREPTAADADAIATILIAGWRSAYREIFDASVIDSPEFEDERRARWRTGLGSGQSAKDPKIVVAEESGVVVGWVSFGSPRQPGPDPKVGELWGLYVDPTRWGSGAATALAGRVLEDIAAAGF